MEVTLAFLKDKLLANGLRPSFQRIKVLEYLYAYQHHPTVDEIYTRLVPELPSLSRTTVYNILHRFEESGLLRSLTIDQAEARYDLTLHPHGHFHCLSCGAITNFEINFDQLAISDLRAFKIQEHNVFYRGLCPNCLEPTQS